MRIHILMEDRAKSAGFVCEHGFSVLVKSEKHCLLVDAGASPKTFDNAALFGVTPSDIDALILTHGHYDHGGGLPFFAEKNPTAKIYIGKGANGDFYSERAGENVYIGLDRSVFLLPQAMTVSGFLTIDEELSIFSDVSGKYRLPPANRKLKKRENGALVCDDFLHEQYAVINENGKSVVVSGCAHRGLPNILDSYEKRYGGNPDVLISGFHTGRTESYTAEELSYINDLAEHLKQTETVYYTGHCTGSTAFSILEKHLPGRIFDICAGDEFVL